MPVPWPPNTTCRNRLNSGTRPPRGINESMAPFTAPVMVPVVTVANRAVGAAPKRSSLPSKLGPLSQGASRGFPACSAEIASRASPTNSPVTRSSSRVPWRRLPRKRPKASMVAAGMATMAPMASRFVIGLGFSKGWAELAPKKPPPFSPSCLIASKPATGPRPRIWVAPSRVITLTGPPRVMGTPLISRIKPNPRLRGSSTRVSERIRSLWKLPRGRPQMPRIKAKPTARPVAAEVNIRNCRAPSWARSPRLCSGV